MKSIVSSNLEKCVGCNRCTRECPIEMANLTYLDAQGNIKVRVEGSQCIACGACISVCKHEARDYVDDVDAFFSDLAAGLPISLIAAPSIRTNFPQWKRLLTYLKRLGVRKIYDVSLGADICVWAHLRYMEQYKPRTLITQPCAAIVSYCEVHRPALLKNLSPVHSPMACTAVYMRRYEGVQGDIAALSPCIAKAHEFEATGLIQYNVTFAKLTAYIKKHHIELPLEESGFDHLDGGLGSLFPAPGGLKENLEFFTGKSLRVDTSEGREVYDHLDTYVETSEDLLPQIFDVLNCEQGCNIGSGCAREQNIFQIQATMDAARQTAHKRDRASFDALYQTYGDTFALGDFLRAYQPADVPAPSVTEKDIAHAFHLLDKDTYAKQNFNCGACGSDTCREMARRIALGINIPLNCIVKSRDDMQTEHRKNTDAYQRNAEYIALIHQIGGYLLAKGDNDYALVVTNALQALCTTLAGNRVYIWRLAPTGGEVALSPRYTPCEKLVGWTLREDVLTDTVSAEWLPGWLDSLLQGAHKAKVNAELTPAERLTFGYEPTDEATVLAVPIQIKGELWGFLALHCDTDRTFSSEEISVVNAGGILIVSSILEQEMTQRLIEAREEALSGTRAKSDFLSRMSHEIRTPMNAIIGMTKIADATSDIGKMKYCLSTIHSSSTHLLGLINDVLDMSKIEAGKFELDHSPFHVEKMLMRICNIIIDKAEQKHQTLRIVLGRDLPMHFFGDEMRLSQVITNLLSNAVKFTPEGGQITLEADVVAEHPGQHTLRFSVQDTGIGMTPDQTLRLFNAFEQADRTITTRFGGTGLGLAISKNIVEKMDGRIWVDSVPGKGSNFSFEIVLTRNPQPEGAVIFGGIRPADIRLLIVDGDMAVRAQFKAITDKFGIHADVADGGDGAVAQVEAAARNQQPYDVIFLDYDMPKAMSLATVERLQNRIDKNTVIVMTSFSEWSRIEKSVNALGVTRFISKPLFPSNILDAINDVIGRTAKSLNLRPAVSAADMDFSKVSLLLAEDIEINREIFITLLEETRITIDTAENGRIAVEKFTENPEKYDIIVMDLQMPEMDGYTATRTIRTLDMAQAKTIPIIAMTANAFQEDIDKCLASGMDGHLSKPIDEKALMEKIAFYTQR